MRFTLWISVLLLMISGLTACGPSAGSLRQLEEQIKKERSQNNALRDAKEVAQDYHAFLETKRGRALVIGKETISKAIQSMLPYTYRGAELSKQYLSGEISFVKMSDLRFLSGNRARVYLYFDGRNLKTKKVPSYARGQVKSLKKAAREGRVEVEVSVFVHNGQRILVLDPEPIQVQFKQENTGSNQSRFLDALRKKIFNGQKKIPLPPQLQGPVKALTTPNHLVLMGS